MSLYASPLANLMAGHVTTEHMYNGMLFITVTVYVRLLVCLSVDVYLFVCVFVCLCVYMFEWC